MTEGVRAEAVCLIPAWNEEMSIADVVRGARDVFSDVVVIDDGSTDQTALTARRSGATVLSHTVNGGVCAALRTGFLYASRLGATAVVQVDGDGQHPPAEARRVLAELLESDADLVIGSRFSATTAYQLPLSRRAGVSILRLSTRAITGRSFTDPSSGLRAFSGRLCSALARDFPDHFLSDTYELLCAAAKSGYRVKELPVTMRVRSHGKSSAGSFAAGLRVVRSVSAMHLGLGFVLPSVEQVS